MARDRKAGRKTVREETCRKRPGSESNQGQVVLALVLCAIVHHGGVPNKEKITKTLNHNSLLKRRKQERERESESERRYCR